MKIPYEKPSVRIEHYELSQSIAACVTKIGFLNSQCVINDPDATENAKNFAERFSWFTQEGGCLEYTVNGEKETDGMCYHTNANAMFNS